MKKTRRIEITLESRTLVFRTDSNRAYCPQCVATRLLTPDEAAAIARTTTRTIFHWVETEQLHFLETDEGRLLICPDSLPTPN